MQNIPSSLDSRRLRIVSPPRESNDADVAALLSNEQCMTHLTAMSKRSTGGWTLAEARSRRQQQEIDQAHGRGWFATIHDKNTGEFMGIGGLRSIDWGNKSGEMGIILFPKYWRAGVCTEAHLALLEHSFLALQLHRITFVTASSNTPMRSFCVDVLHATHEATLRDLFAIDWNDATKGFKSAELYSLLGQEWDQARISLLSRLEKLKL